MKHQAIVTRYHAATPTIPARVVARTAGIYISVPWDNILSEEYNHRNAVIALAKSLKWSGCWYPGRLAWQEGEGVFVYVCGSDGATEAFWT